jgi:hypothetical protein
VDIHQKLANYITGSEDIVWSDVKEVLINAE